QLASFFTAGAIIVLGIYAALFIDNIIKKIIGLSFITEGVNLFLVTIGYKPGGIVSIFLPGMSREWFFQNSAYPLPYAMVLTSIVIGASTLAVMLGIVIILYKKHGTLSSSKVLRDDEEMGDAGE
ncbi:MAG: cation:proton antiporter subunit C, partial [Methanobacteriaceae archaeon]|nr:cation:proton antiporter subunit C [Methanobacteriaceae archaeon]